MAINNYYGDSKELRTVIDLYYLNLANGEKNIYSQLFDQDAYDAWHLWLYIKEIIEYKKLLKQKDNFFFKDIPRKEKNLLLYIIMAAYENTTEKPTIVELGSSLFEMIDGLESIQKYICSKDSNLLNIDLKNYIYNGIDISDVLCETAIALHKDYIINTYHSVECIVHKFNILYTRAVSSYAFTTSQELANFINLSDIAFMNLFVSKKETFYTSLLKPITYFSLEELDSYLNKPLFHLFGERAPVSFSRKNRDVLEGFFICCKPKFLDKFMEMSSLDKNIKNYFIEKKIVPKNVKDLI